MAKGCFGHFLQMCVGEEESWLSPLGKKLFQPCICFDSESMHRIMCKMGVT